MKKYNAVELINENLELNKEGIHQGFMGILIEKSQKQKEWLVMFFNPKNEGEYATALVFEHDLKLLGDIPAHTIEILNKIIKKRNFIEKTQLNQPKLKEYDKVMLLLDKPEYENAGVYAGMCGCVISEYAIKGKWEVIFSEDGTGKDIASIEVDEVDLQIIE